MDAASKNTNPGTVSVAGAYIRGTLYIAAAMLTAAMTFTNWPLNSQQVMSVILAGVIAARSYMDKSPTQMRDDDWYNNLADEANEAARRNRRLTDVQSPPASPADNSAPGKP